MVQFITHRGHIAVAPENTPRAFEAALALPGGLGKVTGIELDVRLTGDHRVVVFHDETLSRMCGSKDLVEDRPYETMAKISAASPRMARQAIPLFQNVLRQVRHRKRIYCEIKPTRRGRDTMALELAALLREYKPLGDVVLHSFSAEWLEAVHAATCELDVKYGFLFDRMESLDAIAGGLKERLDYLHPEYHLLLAEPETVLGHGLTINTWTVNRHDDLRRLLALKDAERIEGIITDNLSLCFKAPNSDRL